MDWDSQNAARDLRWYFIESPGDCGIRSAQGGFEVQMEARSLVGKPGDGIHVKESYSRSEDDHITERRLECWGRARRIHERLSMLPPELQHVLEAQFGCVKSMGDISLTLASRQPAAKQGHLSAVSSARKALQRRQEDQQKRQALGQKQRGKSQVKPKKRLEGTSSVRDWLLFICSSEDGREQLDAIIEQARAQLKLALDAYQATACAPS
jgi:hypothetical protein